MIGLIAAPSNLGLRPPEPGAVPGCAKAPEALREAGLYHRLMAAGAIDCGVVLPGRYRDDWVAGAGRLRNQDTIVEHCRRLAERLTAVLDEGIAPLVLGGDCGLLIGAALALRRRGRYALVHIDGHTDFRHPGNSARCASLAGEDLAAAVGLHWPAIGDIDGLGPYFRPEHTIQVGCRADDEGLVETRGLLRAVVTAPQIAEDGAELVSSVLAELMMTERLDGYWLHLDVDVLDPSIMPAVDSPDPDGLSATRLMELLTALAPGASGAEVTVFDPDLDPTGEHAALLATLLGDGFAELGIGIAFGG
ncbi:MAG TPA: arginase family protein [Pseudonocardiaceae bacterium]|jgi:arginase